VGGEQHEGRHVRRRLDAHQPERRGDGDLGDDPRVIDRQPDGRAEGVTDDVERHPGLAPVELGECGRHVGALVDQVPALEVGGRPEVEAQRRDPGRRQGAEQGRDHGVVAVATEPRVRMAEHGRPGGILGDGQVGIELHPVRRRQPERRRRGSRRGVHAGGRYSHLVPGTAEELDKLPIKMLNDRLLVRIPDKDGERRSQGGIVIPATAQIAKRLVWAEVVALGQNVRAAQVGDLVLFSPEDRYEVEVQGTDFIMLRERDLHAVAAERIEASTGLYL
jgi:chaperonin GroES